jgi:hypothetical protein
MLTDKPEVYQTHIVEAAKRTIPILFTRPGQVYEVNPSRIANLDKADTEVSGGGPRPFDADQLEYCNLYLQEINTPFENWMVLGRTGDEDSGFRVPGSGLQVPGSTIGCEELGLKFDTEYLVFEFWTKRFLGVFQGKLVFPQIDTTYKCQLFCIREKQGHPQLLATNRHISCGGVDLEDVTWDNLTLSGKSLMVGKDRYDLYIYEPEGYEFSNIVCNGAEVLGNKKEGRIRIISLFREENGSVNWKLLY